MLRRAVEACRGLGSGILVRHTRRSGGYRISGMSRGLVRRNRDVSTAGVGVGRLRFGLIHVVEDGPSCGNQLHQQVEVADIAAQDRAAVLEGGEEDEGVVHGSAAIFVVCPMQARQDAGEDGGFAPDFAVGGENAGWRPVVYDGSDLADDGGCSWVEWVEPSAQIDQFRFDDGRVPGVLLGKQLVEILREPRSAKIDVDGSVIQNLIQKGKAGEKMKVRVAPSLQPSGSGIQLPDGLREIRIQGRDPQEGVRGG